MAYQAAGRITEAIALHRARLRGILHKLGPEHPDTLRSLSNLATAYRQTGRSDEAIPMVERVLAVAARRNSAPTIPTR